MILDELKRKRSLSENGAVAEVEVGQKMLEAELMRKQIAAVEAEVNLKRRELKPLTNPPFVHRVHFYKFDVCLGKYLTPQGVQRIVLGKHQKQAPLFVQSF